MIKNIGFSQFVHRQFSPDYSGTFFPKEETAKLLNLVVHEGLVYDAYAPFCKTVSISNFVNQEYRFPNLFSSVVLREDAFKKNARLCTAYEARNEEESPVLTEWVEGVDLPIAEYLYLVVYSAEQMEKEGENTQDFDWLVVSIQAGNSAKIEPMKPITAMRNVLGVEFGGSGVEFNEQEYKKSVQFWSKYISVR